MSRGRVLVTRPNEDAKEIAADIRAKGYDVCCEAFLNVVRHDVDFQNIEQYDGLIFTSRNGVRVFCHNEKRRNLLVYAVGEATAEEARHYGFKNVHISKNGDVSSLQDLLHHEQDKKLLYVRGQHVTQELKNENIDDVIAYHTEIIEKINLNVKEAIAQGDYSHVIVFSKRTAESLLYALKDYDDLSALNATQCLCLGASMAKVVSVLPWWAVKIAKTPQKQSILDLLD